MAKQTGPYLFVGTMDNVTGYKMNGRHYVKKKSSLSGRRVKKDLCFANTRRNSNWFGEASTLASKLYRELPLHTIGRKEIWYSMKKRAQELVRNGKPKEEIILLLKKEFILPLLKKNCPTSIPVQKELGVREIPNEIILGRTINPGVELKLVDQLAIANSFVRNILSDKRQKRTGKKISDRFRR